MGQFIRSSDLISGQEATATAIIEGKVVELFYVKTFEANMEKNKDDVKMLGRRATGHKAAGWNGTGSMNIYYITSEFRRLMNIYAKTGRDFYFQISVTNEDPSSSVGKQTCIVSDCNLDAVVIAKIDVDATALDEDLDFTFEGWNILDQFGQPIEI